MLIGLHGLARSGKDTVGEYLARYGFFRYALADPIRSAIVHMFKIPYQHCVDPQFKEVVNEFWGFSPRQMMQLLGTEGSRNVFREDIWLKRAELEIAAHKDVVITDVRFDNEAEWVYAQGGEIWRIIRDSAVPVSAHASEAGIDDGFIAQEIFNNGTYTELFLQVDAAREAACTSPFAI